MVDDDRLASGESSSPQEQERMTLPLVQDQASTDLMLPDAKLDEDDLMFGYYMDLKRGQMDTDNKITMIGILDNVLTKVYETQRIGAVHKLQTTPSEDLESFPNETKGQAEQQLPPTTLPKPILHTSELYDDLSNTGMSVNMPGANLRYVGSIESAGTALRNVGPIKLGPGLNKSAKTVNIPTPQTLQPPENWPVR